MNDTKPAFVVGLGALGNAAIWALARTSGLTGNLFCIDPEVVELSNLQRYILTRDNSIGTTKASMAAAEFALCAPQDKNSISVEGIDATWQEFVDARGNYHFDRVLLALDSAEGRMAVQSSLPRWVTNGWTQAENLGVTRHPNFETNACVTCLYMPAGIVKSHEQLVGEALRAQTDEERLEIKRLLHLGTPVGETFVRRIA